MACGEWFWMDLGFEETKPRNPNRDCVTDGVWNGPLYNNVSAATVNYCDACYSEDGAIYPPESVITASRNQVRIGIISIIKI